MIAGEKIKIDQMELACFVFHHNITDMKIMMTISRKFFPCFC